MKDQVSWSQAQTQSVCQNGRRCVYFSLCDPDRLLTETTNAFTGLSDASIAADLVMLKQTYDMLLRQYEQIHRKPREEAMKEAHEEMLRAFPSRVYARWQFVTGNQSTGDWYLERPDYRVPVSTASAATGASDLFPESPKKVVAGNTQSLLNWLETMNPAGSDEVTSSANKVAGTERGRPSQSNH